MTKKNPLISMVIVAGPGRKKELFHCIRSIFKSSYKQFEILVIDNSCDSTLAKDVKEDFPTVRLFRMPKNTGIFGYNVAFVNLIGDYIFVLDNDCAVRKNTLQAVIDTFKKNVPAVGILSCNVYSPIKKRFDYPHFTTMKPKTFYHYAGEASVFKREIIDRVGNYDEDFFCWYHEVDFAIRVVNQGYTIQFGSDIIVDHYASTMQIRPFALYLSFRNMAWFTIKHFNIVVMPLIVLRNILTIAYLPIRKGSLKALYYGFVGYLVGWLTLLTPLKKRKVISLNVEKDFLKFYLFNWQ